jgi:2-methylisocitrate lyase-like PEP mutase family enzyme
LFQVLYAQLSHLDSANHSCLPETSANFISCIVFSGFCVSAGRLGLPDAGLISYGEMVDQGRLINESVSIPVIGDGDNGYGNSMNIKRTVKGYINAGFAGIMLEDQVCSLRNIDRSFQDWHLQLS